MADEDHSENRVTIWMSTQLRDDMDDRVDWKNSSRSEWIREAVQYRQFLDDALDDAGVELPDDESERKEIIQEIVQVGARVMDYTQQEED